jgi:hypothetical protein
MIRGYALSRSTRAARQADESTTQVMGIRQAETIQRSFNAPNGRSRAPNANPLDPIDRVSSGRPGARI